MFWTLGDLPVYWAAPSSMPTSLVLYLFGFLSLPLTFFLKLDLLFLSCCSRYSLDAKLEGKYRLPSIVINYSFSVFFFLSLPLMQRQLFKLKELWFLSSISKRVLPICRVVTELFCSWRGVFARARVPNFDSLSVRKKYPWVDFITTACSLETEISVTRTCASWPLPM